MQRRLIKKGAEADIFLVDWGGRKAISKVRTPKAYRHHDLDAAIRKQRTIHEVNFISAAKRAGVASPFVYFVDPVNSEIVMEYVEGRSAKNALTSAVCREMGRYAALLHAKKVIHGDLTTSNFIIQGKRLVLVDYGLAYYSERDEDAATDLRLIKEVFASAHVQSSDAFEKFIDGYRSVAGKRATDRILENVMEIEQRGRYARIT